MEPRDNSIGIVLFAHGSSVDQANRGVHDLARQVQDAGPYGYVRAAFLEQAEPSLSAALAEAVEAGLRQIIVIPFFLTMGVHLRRDLPKLVAAEKKKYPGLKIQVGPPLEGHPLMVSMVLGRVQEAIESPGE